MNNNNVYDAMESLSDIPNNEDENESMSNRNLNNRNLVGVGVFLVVLVVVIAVADMAGIDLRLTTQQDKNLSSSLSTQENKIDYHIEHSFRKRLLTAQDEHFEFLSSDGAAVGTVSFPSAWLKSVTTDWMTALPDDTPLNEISIPGTHNSGAREGGLSEIGAIIGHGNWVRTQAWTIPQQLSAGIRYFDIRCRRAGQSFPIHHGEVFQDIYFGNVLNYMRTFFTDHPGETVLMRVKEEHTPQDGSLSFGDIWDLYTGRYGYGDLFARFIVSDGNQAQMPKLQDVRGKIVVLRDNDEIDDSFGIEYSGFNALMEVQDYWKIDSFLYSDGVSIQEKKDAVTEYIDKARTSSKIILNHLSAIGPPDVDTLEVAEYTNPEAYEDIGSENVKQSVGVIIMDWPGDGLIYRIVKSNFEQPSLVQCDSQTIRFTGETTWVEFQLPSGATEGDVIHFDAGAKQKYQFPWCRRVRWSDVQFACDSDAQWNKISGSYGRRDYWCRSSNTNQPYLATGTL